MHGLKARGLNREEGRGSSAIETPRPLQIGGLGAPWNLALSGSYEDNKIHQSYNKIVMSDLDMDKFVCLIHIDMQKS